jgi:hypothetical protein
MRNNCALPALQPFNIRQHFSGTAPPNVDDITPRRAKAEGKREQSLEPPLTRARVAKFRNARTRGPTR